MKHDDLALVINIAKYRDANGATRNYNILDFHIKRGEEEERALFKSWHVSAKSFSVNSNYNGRLSRSALEEMRDTSAEKVRKTRILQEAEVKKISGTYEEVQQAIVNLHLDNDLLLSYSKARDLAFTLLSPFKPVTKAVTEEPAIVPDEVPLDAEEATAEAETSSLNNWGMF